ncbi:hypothetical protein D9M70_440800 [compost metagenome]
MIAFEGGNIQHAQHQFGSLGFQQHRGLLERQQRESACMTLAYEIDEFEIDA